MVGQLLLVLDLPADAFDDVPARLVDHAAGRLDGALVLVVLSTVRQVSEKLRQA